MFNSFQLKLFWEKVNDFVNMFSTEMIIKGIFWSETFILIQ